MSLGLAGLSELKSEPFKILWQHADIEYETAIAATAIVEKFIREKRLIVYGGGAIDGALRLKGSALYSDDLLADWDFFSPTNIEHAQDIADILFAAGFTETRALIGFHPTTMKVDASGLNHWVADISFCPRALFDIIPTIEVDGILMVHPNYQRIDMHSALSFPFDNAPREVVFQRWARDITRFNLLTSLYPIAAPTTPTTPVRLVETSTSLRKYVWNGFAAYALIYNHLLANCGAQPIDAGIISAELAISDTTISFPSINNTFELIHYDLAKAQSRIGAPIIATTQPFGTIIPESISLSGAHRIDIYSTSDQMVSINEITIGTTKFRTVNVQFLLKFFLAKYIATRTTQEKLASAYLGRYCSLLKMIEIAERVVIERRVVAQESADEFMRESPLFLSIYCYGFNNISTTDARIINRLQVQKHEKDVKVLKLPITYTPSKKAPRPVYDYSHPLYATAGIITSVSPK